jgi:erythromycin esterase-like protein
VLEARLQEELKVIKTRDAELATARNQKIALDTDLQAAHKENARQAASYGELEAAFQKTLQAVRARDAELQNARREEARFEEELKAIRKSHEEEIRQLRRKLAEPVLAESTKTHIIQQQMRVIARLNQEIIALNHQSERFQNLLQSTSWRITAPLRAAKIQWNRLMGSP